MSRKPLFWNDKVIKKDGNVTTLFTIDDFNSKIVTKNITFSKLDLSGGSQNFKRIGNLDVPDNGKVLAFYLNDWSGLNSPFTLSLYNGKNVYLLIEGDKKAESTNVTIQLVYTYIIGTDNIGKVDTQMSRTMSLPFEEKIGFKEELEDGSSTDLQFNE